MKKTIQLLIIMLLMFMGIKEVSAETQYGDIGTFDGTCELINSSTAPFSCTYSCNITKDESYLKFNYSVSLNKGKLVHEIIDDTIETNENSFFGENGWLGDGSYRVKKEFRVNLFSYPSDNDFEVKNKLTCLPITTSTNLKHEVVQDTTNTRPGVKHVYSNNIYISVDQSYVPDDRDQTIDNSCGFLGSNESNVIGILKKIYTYTKIIIPLLVVVLGIGDFIKLVITGKDDDMKKGIEKFAKRIILAIVFILVPILIQILINISGINSQYSQVNDGIKAIGCILG